VFIFFLNIGNELTFKYIDSLAKGFVLINITNHNLSTKEYLLNKPQPKFPNWSEVLHKLFHTDTFNEAGLNHNSLSHLMHQLETLEKKYVFPISEPDMMVQSFESSSLRKLSLTDLSEEEILVQYDKEVADTNQFTVLGDAQTMQYLRVHSKVSGLLEVPSPDDLTLARICGMDDDYELYHPEDVIHTIRFGLVTLLVISTMGMEINPFSDNYEVEFRMGFNSPERFKTVKRNCKLSNKGKDEIGTRHFDVWTIEDGHSEFSNVKATINIRHNQSLRVACKVLFFVTNCILLDITPRDAILANCLNKYGYKYYREQLNELCNSYFRESQEQYDSESTSNMKSNLIKKINARIVENTKTQEFKASVQKRSLHFKCGQLGILQMPAFLEKCIWQGVEF